MVERRNHGLGGFEHLGDIRGAFQSGEVGQELFPLLQVLLVADDIAHPQVGETGELPLHRSFGFLAVQAHGLGRFFAFAGHSLDGLDVPAHDGIGDLQPLQQGGDLILYLLPQDMGLSPNSTYLVK
ncbi:MAG: hypothetical protein HZC05_04220 [Candidatus Magasanikbacteria bacterium]|nr:hypothetical protein [Candidatus Magasanikbacteria bacterium]